MSDDRWITFDCYGTLLDWQTAFRRILGPVAQGRLEELVHGFHAVEPDVEREMPTASYRQILREGVRRAAVKSGVALADPDFDLLATNWHVVQPFDDTVAALTELHRQGWKLGILTNCDVDMFESTRAALGVEIDLVVTAEEVGSYKPHPGHFVEFERRTGVDRAHWVHAAVSWWHDMLPARDLGLRRVWVDREDSGNDPSVVTARVRDMAGLAGIAAELHTAS